MTSHGDRLPNIKDCFEAERQRLEHEGLAIVNPATGADMLLRNIDDLVEFDSLALLAEPIDPTIDPDPDTFRVDILVPVQGEKAATHGQRLALGLVARTAGVLSAELPDDIRLHPCQEEDVVSMDVSGAMLKQLAMAIPESVIFDQPSTLAA